METYGMARRSKHEYLQVMWPRYQRAGRAEKTMLLDEFTQVCGYHLYVCARAAQLAVVRVAMPPACRVAAAPVQRGDDPRAGPGVGSVWVSLFAAGAGGAAAVLPWVRPRVSLTAEVARQLLAISPRQMDRRLQPRKRTLKRRLYGTTGPGSLLKHQSPLRQTTGRCTSRAIWKLIWCRTPGPPPAENFSIPWTAWISRPAG